LPSRSSPQNWFESVKKGWALLAEIAVFIFGVLSSFLLPPPGWVSAGGGGAVPVRLAQFVVTVLVGLIFLLVQKWNRKKHVLRWALITIGFLIVSLGAFFGYQYLLDRRTCEYARSSVVIGTRYTDHAQAYVRQNPNSTCSDLLEDFAGKAADIWTPDSINNSRYILALTYILTIPLFTTCIISVVQAVYCQSGKR
jgi:hypothetical protein